MGKNSLRKKIKELVSYIRTFSAEAATAAQVVAKKEAVVEAGKASGFKSSMRWVFLIVITVALAGGAISEWKKLKSESK